MGVVTVTSTVVAADPGGAVAKMWLSSTTPNAPVLSRMLPKWTPDAAENPVPTMVTPVPPTAEPELGASARTTGVPGVVNVNLSAMLVALVPAGLTTVTSTGPAAAGGLTTFTLVSEAGEGK